MNEKLLHFIWQFQYYNKSSLTTVSGDALHILFQGNLNRDQGPDFTDARVMIGGTVWAGMIELHCKTTDWQKHGHDADRNYNTVVLHVVWEHDAERNDIPVLELKDRVSKIMLDHYAGLMNAVSFIPCQQSISTINELSWKSWKQRLVAERLLKKTERVNLFLEQTQ